MKKIIIILCLIWIGFIAYNTSQVGEVSNDKSISMVEVILGKTEEVINNHLESNDQSININKNDVLIEKLNKLFRKFAHAFEFSILAILVYCLLSYFNLKNREVIIYTLFIVLLYAVIDEFRQLYIPQRGSSVKDVVIDFVGGVGGVMISQFVVVCKGMIFKSVDG